MELEDRKSELRRTLRGEKGVLGEALRRAAGRELAAQLAQTDAFRLAPRLALYADLADEIPTRLAFERARSLGKALLFPRCTEGPLLEFAPVSDWGELSPGRYGVLEPPSQRQATPLEAGDLVLVPGMAFDRAGRRLGRGGGFYDRSFSPGGRGRPGGPKLFGVVFSVRLLDRVPAGPADRMVDAVVTEREIVWCQGGERSDDQ